MQRWSRARLVSTRTGFSSAFWCVLVKSEIFKYIHVPRAPKTSILMGPFEVLGCDFKVSLDAVAESESVSKRGTLRLMDEDASYRASFAAVRRMAVNPLEVSGSERRENKIDMVGARSTSIDVDSPRLHTSFSF